MFGVFFVRDSPEIAYIFLKHLYIINADVHLIVLNWNLAPNTGSCNEQYKQRKHPFHYLVLTKLFSKKKKLTWSAWHNHWGTIFIPKHMRNRLPNEKEGKKKTFYKCLILLSAVFLQHVRPGSDIMCASKCACVKMSENPVTQQNQTIDGLRWYIYALKKCRRLMERTCVTYRLAMMNHHH